MRTVQSEEWLNTYVVMGNKGFLVTFSMELSECESIYRRYITSTETFLYIFNKYDDAISFVLARAKEYTRYTHLITKENIYQPNQPHLWEEYAPKEVWDEVNQLFREEYEDGYKEPIVCCCLSFEGQRVTKSVKIL